MRLFVLAALVIAAASPAQNQGLVLANGTTAYLDAPYAPSLIPTGGITAEAWVTYNSALAPGWRFPTVLRGDPSPNVSSYFLRVEAGQTQINRLLWWVSTTTGNFTTSWIFPAGSLSTWTHVAGTYDGSMLRLFVNGAQVAQTVGTGPILNTSGIFRIGSGDLSVTGGETWNGEIDEVRIWPFARSAGAIAASMNQRLSSMPGEVSTWNLDGDGSDSSGTNTATASGAVVFAPNTLVLQSPPTPAALALGYGSGCQNSALAAINSLATVGNQAFALVGTRAPAGGVGVLLVGSASLPAPFPIFGVDVFVDISTGALATVLASNLGTGEVGLPIPNNQTLVGFGLYSQFAWFDGSCASGFSASGATVTLIVP